MSHIILQIGQCGNQLGSNLFKFLFDDLSNNNEENNSDYVEEGIDRWFHQNKDGTFSPRAILMDAEKKVINYLKFESSEEGKWCYNKDNVALTNSGGSANNWTYGYKETGPNIIEKISDVITKEIEKCDHLRSFITLGSTAGGTGSGTGTYLAEYIKDNFPQKPILSSFIMPFSSGDVVTQDYNTLLTITKLYDVADAIMIFQNDYLHNLNSDILQISNSELSDINVIIAEQMGCILQPVSYFSHCYLDDFLLHLTPHPSFKLLTLRSVPHISKQNLKFEDSLKWEVIIKHCKQVLCYNTFSSKLKPSGASTSKEHNIKYHKSVASFLVCRGTGPSNLDKVIKEVLCDPQLYPPWVPPEYRIKEMFCERAFNGKERFVTMANNTSIPIKYFEEVIDQAWLGYVNQAHVHHYYSNGLEEQEFIKSFTKAQSIVQDYNSLYN